MRLPWYCSLPLLIDEFASDNIHAFFWYVSGDYPDEYPSAGIDSISVFAGLSLPAVDVNRYHIVGLGYDNIRTETIVSIIEPESLISCYAYNPLAIETKENAYEINKKIIGRSLLSVALPIDNFSGMVDKMCELVYGQVPNSQVIMVPDGPKPLIMAMSLIPEMTKKDGVTCLHVSRNTEHYSRIDVVPRKNEIYGFQVLKSEN